MVNLKRYEFKFYQTNCDCHYIDNPEGEWVKFEDIKELLNTSTNTDSTKLSAEIVESKKPCDYCTGSIRPYKEHCRGFDALSMDCFVGRKLRTI